MSWPRDIWALTAKAAAAEGVLAAAEAVALRPRQVVEADQALDLLPPEHLCRAWMRDMGGSG